MPIGFNEPVTFGSLGTAAHLNGIGIDFSDHGRDSWTTAPVAEMDIDLPFARQDVILELEVTPYIVETLLPAQKLFIYLGGLFIGYAKLTGHAVRGFPVSRAAISGRLTRLSLVIPTASSPRSLNLSTDERELGLCLTSMVFRTNP